MALLFRMDTLNGEETLSNNVAGTRSRNPSAYVASPLFVGELEVHVNAQDYGGGGGEWHLVVSWQPNLPSCCYALYASY